MRSNHGHFLQRRSLQERTTTMQIPDHEEQARHDGLGIIGISKSGERRTIKHTVESDHTNIVIRLDEWKDVGARNFLIEDSFGLPIRKIIIQDNCNQIVDFDSVEAFQAWNEHLLVQFMMSPTITVELSPRPAGEEAKRTVSVSADCSSLFQHQKPVKFSFGNNPKLMYTENAFAVRLNILNDAQFVQASA